MSDVRLGATVYINLFDNKILRLYDKSELKKWLMDNVDIMNHHYWRGKNPYLAGVYLTPEQATFFKLKFKI